MSKKIYVGNLPYNSSEEEVRELFEQYGAVESVIIPTDRETGKPRGFGFVKMETEAADAAIEGLEGTEFGGRTLRVNEARERERRGPRPPR